MNSYRVVPNSFFRSLLRHSSTSLRQAPAVKVVTFDAANKIKLTIRFPSALKTNYLEAFTQDSAQELLGRIEKLAFFHKSLTNNETQRKNLDNGDNVQSMNVCLIKDNIVLDSNAPNSDIWLKASVLKIGETEYEVCYNSPTVSNFTLPQYILSGCPLRPHFEFQSANVTDSIFTWYKSLPESEGKKLLLENPDDVHVDDNLYWLKIHEGFMYFTSNKDVNCFLKVVCIPKQGDQVGRSRAAVSEGPVQEARFPFEDRHNYTKLNCDNDSIRCISYNILANAYVRTQNNKFPYASAKALSIHYRKQILLREIIGYNSDIICLQEVQERFFDYDIIPLLQQLGYCGVYKKKGGHRCEGLAIFFRTSKFKVIKKYDMVLRNQVKQNEIYDSLLKTTHGYKIDMSKMFAQDTALQLLVLEHVCDPKRKLVVANTHLYSNKDTPEVRLLQAVVSTVYIEHIIEKDDLHSAGIIFCGDFNSLPCSSTYEYLTRGLCELPNNNSSSTSDPVLKHNLPLESACGTPEFTNFTHEFQGCLDYIFYGKTSLEVTDVVPLPERESVAAQTALPSEFFPSDHLALVCTLRWRSS